MSQTPFEYAGSLHIGTVDFVSPDEIKVTLDIEAPDSVALNAGGPRPFPRVNGYLLVSVDEVYLVGQVEWVTVERSPFPKRRGMQDFGLVDLPYPLRRLRLNPLGMLHKVTPNGQFTFRRGADALPTIGAAVLLPTENQLRSIIESGERRRVKIGTSPLAGDAVVSIDPNRLFGRHLAVLGNTGSGKSCSVAGIIRWSLEQAANKRSVSTPNARFIVLDPNGEYSQAFTSDPKIEARIFKVDPNASELALKVPLWFWNSAEWCSFTQASAKTQRPFLRRALREVKAGRIDPTQVSVEERRLALRRYLSSKLITIHRDFKSGAILTDESKFGFRLMAIGSDLKSKQEEFTDCDLKGVIDTIRTAVTATRKKFENDKRETVEYFRAFNEEQVIAIIDALRSVIADLGGVIYQEGPDEDVPLAFNGTDLADHLEVLAMEENVSQYVDFLVSRIRSFLGDMKLRSVVGDDNGTTLTQWLNEYIGSDGAKNGCISVVDLSLVPTEVVHIVTAVIARMVFEALQRHMRIHTRALPTVIVMEEAHTFIKRYKEDGENQDAASICCQVFEKIAREGRKFGLGLVLSSQRPSELSPTVLSQCNTFLLHRISNDRDQELVQRLVPDNLRGLLRELPSLPSQMAVLLGWASELPVLVRMNDLPKSQQPRSDDPDFWGVWVGQDDEGREIIRNTDWSRIADEWQGGNTEQ
jgi:DNA helicase HerA-like ATPase